MLGDPHWEDGVLTDAVARLIRSGHDRAATAVLTSSELTIETGDSWWDGHDDYIYDVTVTIRSAPEVIPVLAELGNDLVPAFAQAVHLYRDSSGGWVRGDLVRFHPLVAETAIDAARLRRRRAAVGEGL